MIIGFAPTTNTPPKKDATGAFIPEGRNFMKFHVQPPGNLVMVDNTKSAATMKKQVFDALRSGSVSDLHGVAFFCHGLRDRIQFGIRKTDLPELAQLIAAKVSPSHRALPVTLYCCDTGRDDDADRNDDLAEFGGDNGFADNLRDALCKAGLVNCIVDSHTTAAHTTMNPDVRRFEGMGSPLGGVGGYYLVPRGSKLRRKWIDALKTDLRFEFPYLTTPQILSRLGA